MSFIATGLCISALFLAILCILFVYEKKNNTRFFDGFRTRFDFVVLRVAYVLHAFFRKIGGGFFRQIFHYIFHTILGLILLFLRMCDRGLRNMMRVNKTLAKNAERESETRTKLEEIALHKVATALSEEEKKAHKDKMLNGI